MKILNYTPHTVNIINENREIIKSFESQGVARVGTKQEVVGNVEGVEIVKTTYTEIEGLPEEKEDVFYIVSMVVLNASDRKDLICPDTSPSSAIRNEKGQIIGVKRFTV
jgi:hypothetical protein